MRDRKTINTFTIGQPVNEQIIELGLCLFSSHSFTSCNRQFSYSVAGKIKGLSCIEGVVKIIADYHSQTKLTDNLSIVDNQFIYSNKSVTPVTLDIDIQLNGASSWQGMVSINFYVKLRCSLNKFVVHATGSSYSIKNRTKSKLALMQ